MTNEPVRIKVTQDDPALSARLAWFLAQPGCDWVLSPARTEGSDELSVLRISPQGVVLQAGEEIFRFHPSMALLRLMNIQRGETDRYLAASGLKDGDTLYDLTLGLGTDALVSAWAVGTDGHVVGVEKSAIIAAIVRDGLNHLGKAPVPVASNPNKRAAWLELKRVAPRIEVVWSDHLQFLATKPSRAADVVYFDPMFRRTRMQSSSIRPLHRWSEHQTVTELAVAEACRVAKRRVVLKERKGSPLFAALGFEIWPGGKYSQVDYGVIQLGKGG